MTPSRTGGAKDEKLSGLEIKSSAEKMSGVFIWVLQKSRRSPSWQGRWIFYPRMNRMNANKTAGPASVYFRDPGAIGLSHPDARITADGLYQFKNLQSRFSIRGYPKPQILEKIPIEDPLAVALAHQSRERSAKSSTDKTSPSPCSSLWRAASRRWAFAGDRSRRAVS